MWQRFQVKKNERGLLLRNGDVQKLLEPGEFHLWNWPKRYTLLTFSLDEAAFTHALADYLCRNEAALVETHFQRVELADHEAALRYENGVLAEILLPGSRQLYWKAAAPQTFERIDLRTQFELSPAVLATLTQAALRAKTIRNNNTVLQVQVPESHIGLLHSNGQFQRQLKPGRYGFWRFGRELAVELVDTRQQTVEVSGQEILTRDKVSLRLNLAANWQLTDIELAFTQLPKPVDFLYRELQFGLRAAVGTRTLDELLENKQLIDDVVAAHMRTRLAGLGMCIHSVGVKDIVLPGEMKMLLAQVVEAEKAAQANVIRRREETGATRSLLNTAKVMEDNPTALRLKELETLEKLAERIDKISVFGGFDQLLNGMIKLGK
ncbi:slipin family protein [Chitinibacter sp. GC72]|uniref:slipin family protein n=1 Tax=Chitinibacter sp. GC72 TaxID=1526917 RepID=UPI0012F730E2|nr:slipin family protein [Chitinibacter sp. GC72]